MFKLILSHRYDRGMPAIDHSVFAQHGRCQATAFATDDASPNGVGFLDFANPSARVQVPSSVVWNQIGALAVEADARLNAGSPSRRNLIEGGGSFALFVDAANAIRFDVLTLVQGGSVPQWASVASSPGTVPIGRWFTVRALHDGLGQARVWIDGRLVAERNDFVSGVPAVGQEGVTIGNWTLASQFPLFGQLAAVHVWKYDPFSAIRAFLQRASDDARLSWADLLDCIGRYEGWLSLREAIVRLQDVLREVVYLARNAPPEDQQKLFDAIAAYRQAWNADQLGSVEFMRAHEAIADMLIALGGQALAARLEAVAKIFAEFAQEQHGDCLRRSGIERFDPTWADAMANVVSQPTIRKIAERP